MNETDDPGSNGSQSGKSQRDLSTKWKYSTRLQFGLPHKSNHFISKLDRACQSKMVQVIFSTSESYPYVACLGVKRALSLTKTCFNIVSDSSTNFKQLSFRGNGQIPTLVTLVAPPTLKSSIAYSSLPDPKGYSQGHSSEHKSQLEQQLLDFFYKDINVLRGKSLKFV